MTRMWLVPPSELCQQHLAGEHKEIHDLVGFIRAGKIGKVQFHATRGQVFPALIEQRHEALEDVGGWDSPIEVPDVAAELQMAEPTEQLIEHNMGRLRRHDCPCPVA